MKIVSTSAARQRFGALLKAALREPVFILRQGRDLSVIIALDQYKRICGINDTEWESLTDRNDDRPR